MKHGYREIAVSEISKDERTWAMLTHLSALTAFFTGGFGAIIGPLVVWLIKKDEMPFVDDQGKEALNFQITMLIATIVSAVLVLVLIGFLMLVVVGIFDLVMVIIAAVKANDGEQFRYPLTIRFLK
ncbi:MAG: DUF4870 domain-containing protein [Gammaproteobacteria bacterium]|nr:DUF4870 domain-containing protein [Gammaproteobacteria bacterium]NNF61607.1 DUF4870 domain-containing protein [Gammaproteobacteria bacterium]